MDQFISKAAQTELDPNNMKEEDGKQKVFTKDRRVLSA
jgi:hypothetical protein